jgi:hypothetical protein
MTMLLDTAKFAWSKSKSKKAQFVMDDMSTEILDFNGTEFNESEYGIFVGNSAEDTELISSMKQLAHAMVQNDKINVSDLMTILTSPSVSSMRRALETSESERKQSEQKQFEDQMKIQQADIQARMESEQAERDLKEMNNIRDNQTRLAIGLRPEEGNNEDAKLDIERQRLSLEKDKQRRELSIKERDVAEKKRHNLAAESISRRTKTAK